MKGSKRQDLPVRGTPLPEGLGAGLWVVATPIGNLGDFTARARAALEAADAVLCEDTRRTGSLMAAFGLQARLVRLDAHAGDAEIRRCVERLLEGENLALVTDAGTPGISDPGARLVEAAREAGIAVQPVPGASAVVALLSVAGFRETGFVFRGFFPRRETEAAREVAALRAAFPGAGGTVAVWFESPERIVSSIEFIAREEPSARVVAGKELTKLHERILAGSAEAVARAVGREVGSQGARGEWCFAVRFEPRVTEVSPESSEWVKALRCLLDARVSASEAAKRVSQVFDVAKNDVYREALRLSGKKSSEGD